MGVNARPAGQLVSFELEIIKHQHREKNFFSRRHPVVCEEKVFFSQNVGEDLGEVTIRLDFGSSREGDPQDQQLLSPTFCEKGTQRQSIPSSSDLVNFSF